MNTVGLVQAQAAGARERASMFLIDVENNPQPSPYFNLIAAANSSASLGSTPAPRSHAPTPWPLALGSASTTASPADNSPPSVPLPAPNSTPLSILATALLPALVHAHSSLSSSTRPPLEAFSLGDISNRDRRGHYHPVATIVSKMNLAGTASAGMRP